MTGGDLTREEREVLELLRANAPDAPEALAGLDDAARARVLGALSDASTAEHDPSDTADAEGQPGAANDEEPTLEDAPGGAPSGPSTFVDRLLEPTVRVADKDVPVVPSSAGLVVLIIAIILIARACGGGGNPLDALSEAGEDAVERLDDAAEEVDNDRLFDAADRVRGDMRSLTREADADYDDFREVLEAGEAVQRLGRSMLWYVRAAADAAEDSFDVDAAAAAADAARVGAGLVTNNKALDQAESLARRVIDIHLEEHARRADSEEVDEYRSAGRDLIDAARANLVALVNLHVARAEYAEARADGADLDEARDALEEAWFAAEDAERDYDQADDDFTYFGKQVEWRRFDSFESSVLGRWRP